MPGSELLSRRNLLELAGVSLATGLTSAALAAAGERAQLGLVSFCLNHERDWQRQQQSGVDLQQPLPLIRRAAQLGFGGVQLSLGNPAPEVRRAIRETVSEQGLFLEAIINPPRQGADVARFTAEVAAAREMGVSVARTVILPGRRYEQFQSRAEFEAATREARELLRRAEPIVRDHQLQLAVENHKDQRIAERLQLLEEFDPAWIGICLDTGNNLALLEDPLETISALAPRAFTVHLKDQLLTEVSSGFLLGDVPLGQGQLDLPAIVRQIRSRQPGIRLHLELITRDPLLVPCLQADYWETLAEVPARELARTLSWIRSRPRETPQQQVSTLNLDERVALERRNLVSSLNYAREQLGL
jgi:sugar phosphate isomerase/epimerase